MDNPTIEDSCKNIRDFEFKKSLKPKIWENLIGHETSRYHTVHPREIRRFLNSIGECSDLHNTEKYSQRMQRISVLFYQTLIFDDVDLRTLPPDGSPIELVIPNTGSRSVGGSSNFSIIRTVIPGETLRIRSKLKDVYSKMGASGELYFILVETKIEDQCEALVASELATYIRRD